jgi:hypothetical protein
VHLRPPTSTNRILLACLIVKLFLNNEDQLSVTKLKKVTNSVAPTFDLRLVGRRARANALMHDLWHSVVLRVIPPCGNCNVEGLGRSRSVKSRRF